VRANGRHERATGEEWFEGRLTSFSPEFDTRKKLHLKACGWFLFVGLCYSLIFCTPHFLAIGIFTMISGFFITRSPDQKFDRNFSESERILLSAWNRLSVDGQYLPTFMRA